MTSSFLNTLKASGKLSLVMSIVFLAAMMISAYFLFTLPHNLILRGGLPSLELAWPVLINLFVSVGLTFILGLAAINVAMESRKETVVYLEKRKVDQASAGQTEEGTFGELIALSSFRTGLQQAEGEREILQQGLNIVCQQVQAGQGAIYQLKSMDGKKM